MRREASAPRADWAAQVEALGFDYHTLDGEPYWTEDVAYRFDADEIETIEDATRELHTLCLEAVDRIVRDGRCADLNLDDTAAGLVERSWRAREPALYGRMDLSFDRQGFPKLLEYNADTPTALFEAAVVQWHWLEAVHPEADQFNSLHEKLLARWPAMTPEARVHFAACHDSPEDRATAEYLRDTCAQAGFATSALDIADIGWSGGDFIDLDEGVIRCLFKLYPWEWLLAEPFGVNIPKVALAWIEPAWKMLLSNKAILPLLWEFFPGHPNLLPASRRREAIDGMAVRKPLWGREGEGVIVLPPGENGEPAAEPSVFQGFAPLPDFGGRHLLVGSWTIGDEPAGIGLREDATPITRNGSRFVPHWFD